MSSERTSASCSRSRRPPQPAGTLLLAVALLAPAFTAEAAEAFLSIRLVGPDTVEAKPRTTVAVALACATTALETKTLAIEPVLPAGWKVLTAPEPSPVAPGAEDIRIVSLLVPEQAPAGMHAVAFRLRDTAASAAEAECVLRIVVRAEIAVELRLLEAPSFVVAGSTYEARFALRNAGNAPARLALEASASGSEPLALRGVDDPDDVRLEPGELREIVVIVDTDGRRTTAIRDQTTVTVHPRGEGRSGRLAAASSIVEVVPLSSGGCDLWHALPFVSETSAAFGLGADPLATLRQTLTADGSLDAAGEHRLDLELTKQLATDADLLFDPQDRYRLGYRYRFLDVLLGDDGYTVSPLIARDERGRGVRVSVELPPFGVEAMYYRDIWSEPAPQALAAAADFALTRADHASGILYRLGLGALSPLDDRFLFGVWQRYEPVPGISFQLDAALQLDGSGAASPAVLASADGTLGIARWSALFLRAWPDFDGNWHDTQSVLAGAGLSLLEGRLDVRGSFELADGNLLLDPARGEAERRRRISVDARGTVPGWGTRLSLAWNGTLRRDRFPTPAFDVLENEIRFSLEQQLDAFTFGLQSRAELEDDRLADTTLLEHRHVLSVSYLPVESRRWSLSVRYNERISAAQATERNPGVEAGVSLSRGATRWEAGAFTSASWLADMFQSFDAGLRGSFSTLLPWGHTLSATANLSLSCDGSAWEPSASGSLTYSVPFELPVSRVPASASVTGRVYRVGTDEAMPGVLLRLNGLAAVTDGEGSFVFNLAEPGTRYLQVDSRSIPAGLIPDRPMPVAVEAAAGSKTSLSIGLVEGCTVRGTVAVYGFPEGVQGLAAGAADGTQPERVLVGGLGSVIVELSGADGFRRKLTGPDGVFAFTEVRPGSYTLQVIGGRIPAYHTVEEPSRQIDLAPGETQGFEIRVLQDRRTVKMLSTGITVVLERPAVPTAGLTVTLPGATPAPVEVASVEPAPIEPTPAEPAPIEPVPAEPIPPEPAPAQPAPAEPVPVEPAAPEPTTARPEPGEIRFAPREPSREELVMAAQASFDAPELSWKEYLATMLHPVVPGAMPVPDTAAPLKPTAPAPAAASAKPAVPAATPVAKTPAPAAPAAAVPAPAAPAPPSTAPTAAVATTAPAPAVTIDIPLPMPTPRPPVTVPVPTPTPQPFTP